MCDFRAILTVTVASVQVCTEGAGQTVDEARMDSVGQLGGSMKLQRFESLGDASNQIADIPTMAVCDVQKLQSVEHPHCTDIRGTTQELRWMDLSLRQDLRKSSR